MKKDKNIATSSSNSLASPPGDSSNGASVRSEDSSAPALPNLLFGDLWDYAPAPESTDCVTREERYGHFLDGCFVEGHSHIASLNPSNEESLFEIPCADQSEVDRAVGAARKAHGSWSKLSGVERGKWLYRLGRRLQENARELAIIESLDNGKPIKESRDVDLPLAAAHFLYYAGWADKLEYAFPGGRSHRSIGVCGQIIPWNFPLLMLAWKIAPALATGNTVVLKPAETTPWSAIRFAQICEEIGLPNGVVNIIHGGPQTGSLLVNHPGIDKVAFTGSTSVGREIQKALAGTEKRLTLELGGKGAQIIFEDAPLDQALEGVIQGIFFNQGQVCCAGSRLLVQESVLNEVVGKLADRLATIRVGDPLDKNTDLGPIHSQSQLARVRSYVEVGQNEGATLHQASGALPDRGYFFRPCFFTDVSQAHRIAREEIFGPVLAIQSFRTPEEALQKANNTRYGLSAGLWTDKGSKLLGMFSRLRAGVVWGNTFNQFDPASPFGGYLESGFGREGGRHGLFPYLEVSG